MKIITIPFSAFAAIDGEQTVPEWVAWYLAHGIDPAKVIRCYPSPDQTATVFECED